MGASLIAVNIFFSVFVLVAIPAPLIWAIRTAHRDQPTVSQPVALPNSAQLLVVEELAVPQAALA